MTRSCSCWFGKLFVATPNNRSASRTFAVLALLLPATFFLVASHAEASITVSGQTAGGAHYQIVVPDSWNGDLIIWNHGFTLAPPSQVEDLEDQFFVQLLEGYAVAASSYRMQGWALFKTNKDLKALVETFKADFGTPDRIILAGASLGGIVTAAALEKAKLGNIVGAFTYCGVMAGSPNWQAALDLRLLYDAICSGVASGQIPGGASGLPKGSNWTADDVETAVNACTGVDLRRSSRSSEQKANLKRLVELSRIPESFLQTNMWYATLGMSDLVHDRKKLKGRIGVGNEGVDYGDAEINRTIERVEPNKKGARKLAKKFTPRGRVRGAKIVSFHTSGDGLVFVENLGRYASVVPPQNLTSAVVVEESPTHCLFSPAEVLAAWGGLRDWIDGGAQPTADDLQDECEAWELILGGPCRIDPAFQIPSFSSRVRPR